MVRSRRILGVLPLSVMGIMTTSMTLYTNPSQQTLTLFWSRAQGASLPAQSFQPERPESLSGQDIGLLSQVSPANQSNFSALLAQGNAHRWRNGSIATPEDSNPSTVPSRPGRRPGDPLNHPTQRQRPLPSRSPSPQPEANTTPPDPAEEVAPAVIELTPTTRSLNPVLARAMEQQLRNLIGRFESAFLLTRSLDSSTTLTLRESAADLTAADKENSAATETDTTTAATGELPPALLQAEALLQEWDTLIAAGKHTEIQERWLQARNNLWQDIPAERPFAQAEIRAVWLDRGTIVAAQSAEGLEKIFDQLATAGINTVFFETVNAGYPIYPSRVAPQQNPLIGSWDPLKTAVDLAHGRGMTLHAWVWVFAAGNQRHNRILNLPETYLGPVLSGHADWAGFDNLGNPIPQGQDKPFFDPANPEVRRYLIQLMSEIVTEYEVDGLQLDYIRYPFQDPSANRTYGYGDVARWRFHNMTGVDPLELAPRSGAGASQQHQARQQMLWERWTEFRIQQINSFVETLSQTLRRQRPDIILSAAVFTKPEHERLQKIQQDWGTWARNGHIDWVVLMSYAEDTSRFEQLVTPWLVEEDFGNSLVIPGIRILDLSHLAVMDQLQATRDLPTPGYALFATADLEAELATYLEQTQGVTPTQPVSMFQMAFDRYQSLQREWSWLLTQEKLWMQEEQFTSWVNQVNQLEADFLALTTAPTRRNLETVQQSLRQVRDPLNGTLLVETVNGSYRVRAWRHRLLAIDRLLSYAEHSQFRDL